jgi:hypothetical protein
MTTTASEAGKPQPSGRGAVTEPTGSKPMRSGADLDVQQNRDAYHAHASAVFSLSGMRLHRVIGVGDRSDALAIRDDLMTLAAVIDPLIEAIGRMATHEFDGIDKTAFNGVVTKAVEDALIELECWAADPDADEPDFHTQRDTLLRVCRNVLDRCNHAGGEIDAELVAEITAAVAI